MADKSIKDLFAEAIVRLSRDVAALKDQFKLSPLLATAQQAISDPAGALTTLRNTLGQPCAIRYGVVHDCNPYTRIYRVFGDDCSIVSCTRAGLLGHKLLGAYDASTLLPGTPVLYVTHPQHNSSFIVGVLPPATYQPKDGLSDMIGQGTNSGVLVEPAYKSAHPYLAGPAYAGRTPINSLEVGELDLVCETGLKLFLDSYMGSMHVDEFTGLWMFYWDQLCRISGVNFQRWTAGSELESYDDEGEHAWYEGVATYPWEQKGQLVAPGGSAVTNHFPEDGKVATVFSEFPYYGLTEPSYDNQQAYHRLQIYRGYLGQGEKKILSAPPVATGTVQQYGDSTQLLGLCEESTTLHGHKMIRSATSISLIKRPVIVVPRRKVLPPDPAGDTAAGNGYKPSSYFGTGPDHSCNSSPETSISGGAPNALEALSRASGVLDLHAYLFNWGSAHPFHYHVKDFDIPDESDITAIGNVQTAIDWGQINTDWYLSPPTPTAIQIDHRTGGTVNITENQSHITMLENGGIVIGDGFGAEIRLVGGEIRISGARVFLDAAQSVVQWAGRDIVLRARKSVDVTTTTKDIRMIAGTNVQISAGHHVDGSGSGSSTGGVIIESRATAPNYTFGVPGEDAQHSGIILKAPQSEIVGLADSIYLRTGIPASVGDLPMAMLGDPIAPTPGDIVLDASNGDSDVITRSDYVKHFNRCGVAMMWPDSSPDTVTIFTPGGAVIYGDTFVDGVLVNNGDLVTGGNIVAGGTLSEEDDAASGSVDTGTGFETTLQTWAAGCYTDQVDTNWYGAGRPGADATIVKMWASMRTTADYGTTAYLVMEPYWAQITRATGGSVPDTWTEEGLADGSSYGSMQYPFPGYEALIGDTYYEQDLNLVDSDGTAVDRPSGYETDPVYDTPTASVLDGNYPVLPL